jgi:hypothetical protein
MDELQALFNEVHKEITERTAFVHHMQSCQRPKQEYEHIHLEVATRARELKRLDCLIQNELQAE